MALSARSSALVLALSVAAVLLGTPTLWYMLQQGAGSLVYADCRLASPPWGALAGLAVTMGCVGLGLAAWRTAHRPEATPAQQFLARAGCGVAGIFTLGSLAVTAALALVPPCA
jgi:hypothetical protein